MLSIDQRDAFQRAGFLRVPAILSGTEIDQIAEEWVRLWREIDRSGPSIQRRGHDSAGETEDRIDPAYVHSPLLHELCHDKRLTSIAADALGAGVTLFKDKLISKLPGTHGYGLHQDWPYWEEYGVPAACMVTLIIAIDAADSGNGALEIWPERLFRLPAPADEPLDVDPNVLDSSQSEIVTMGAGDGLLLHALAPHRSGVNRSAKPRRAYFITYIASEFAEAAARRQHEVRSPLL